jgi:hypothetical protein
MFRWPRHISIASILTLLVAYTPDAAAQNVAPNPLEPGDTLAAADTVTDHRNYLVLRPGAYFRWLLMPITMGGHVSVDIIRDVVGFRGEIGFAPTLVETEQPISQLEIGYYVHVHPLPFWITRPFYAIGGHRHHYDLDMWTVGAGWNVEKLSNPGMSQFSLELWFEWGTDLRDGTTRYGKPVYWGWLGMVAAIEL